MVKNLIFDIGMVLVGFEPKPVVKAMGFDEEETERILKATVRNEIWKEYDRGVWSTEMVHDAFVATDKEMEEGIRAFLDNMRDTIVTKPEIVPWFKRLRAEGYKIYYLSNYPDHLLKQTLCKMTFMDYVDGGIFSFREKYIKPDPEIFKLVANRYGLIPEECMFFDDRLENVEGARSVGMKAYVFEGLEDADSHIHEKN